MPTLTFLQGLPGSGKSTWAKQQDAVRVNKDDIRAELAQTGWTWSHDNEKSVITIRDARITDALLRGHDVISDDTNFAPIHRETLKGIADRFGATFVEKMFYISLVDAIERDSHREGRAQVGEMVIRRMFKQWHPLEYEPYPRTEGLPWAILCDLDGTAAHITNRTPYEGAKCHQDRPCEQVREVLLALMCNPKYYVIYMSGRDDAHYNKTNRWLSDHQFPYGPLHMRTTADRRDDAIVKEELFDTHVRNRFNVFLVLDDRERVVKMWRRLGLVTWQVQEGSF